MIRINEMAGLEKERDILTRLSGGDKAVFKHIYHLYYNELCRFLYFRFSGQQAAAEDIVQGVLVKLWEKRYSLENVHSLKAYLYKAVYNAALNHLEHESVKNKHQAEILHTYKNESLDEQSMMPDQDKLNEINRHINELPDQTKRVFMLKYKMGKTYKEIAAELNISSKTVETLIYRGLKNLRNKIKLQT